MIKTFIEFVNEELETDEFYDDLKKSQKRLKLIPKFKSDIQDFGVTSTFLIGELKKKFKPKVTILKKPNKKGMF